MDTLKRDYPWIHPPTVACAPMRLIALSKLACEVSNAGGLGFIGAGSDVSTLEAELEKAKSALTVKASQDTMPIGVGFLLWAGDRLLQDSLPILEKYKPSAVWLFAPDHHEQLMRWTAETRRVTGGKSKIWIQIGTVSEAKEVIRSCQPEVLVVQGTDAGGHGLDDCAGLISLLPEVEDAVNEVCGGSNLARPTLVAAGGIMDGRGTAAAIALGAAGVVLGTRYLASPESNIAKGYQDAVLTASDGGVNTARGKLYDTLRGTTDWPNHYGGRSVLNDTWHDARKGMSLTENKRLYDEALKNGDAGWGQNARLTTYAGTGVGLVKSVKPAAKITKELREDAVRILKKHSSML